MTTDKPTKPDQQPGSKEQFEKWLREFRMPLDRANDELGNSLLRCAWIAGRASLAERIAGLESERDQFQRLYDDSFARIAKLESEKKALVAAAYRDAVLVMMPEHIRLTILARTPADAQAALDKIVAERVQELEFRIAAYEAEFNAQDCGEAMNKARALLATRPPESQSEVKP